MFIIRKYDDLVDRPFVFDTFYRHSKKDFRSIDECKKTLADNMNNVLVACDASNHDVIYSFCMFDDKKEVIFGYTKLAFRKFGIFKAILQESKK